MKIILPLIILLMIIFASGCVLDKYPEIAVDTSDLSTQDVLIDFPFKDTRVTGSININLAPYFGAKSSEKTAWLYGNEKDTKWEEKYYNAMTNDPALENLYRNLIIFFDGYSDSHSLSSDEYVEMVTSFVQTIPYKTEEQNTRFPIETVIDDYGDCDDKAVLLAGILSRKGYDAALFNFDIHMTAAISDGVSYRMIETTRYAFVSEEVDLSSFGVTAEVPRIYEIGEGTTPYTSIYKVDAVIKAENELAAECSGLLDKLESLKTVIENHESSLKQRYDASEYRKYSQNIDTYNSYVDSYKNKIDVLHRITDEKYNLGEIYEIVSSMM